MNGLEFVRIDCKRDEAWRWPCCWHTSLKTFYNLPPLCKHILSESAQSWNYYLTCRNTFLPHKMSSTCLHTKSLQSCPTLCNPMVCICTDSLSCPWDFLGKNTEVKVSVVKSLSRVRLLVTPWTAAYQAPPSIAFSRQEYWSAVPLLSPRGISLTKEYNSCLLCLCIGRRVLYHWATWEAQNEQ